MILLNVEILASVGRRHVQAKPWLDGWRTIASAASWRYLQDVRRDFPHADGVRARSGLVVTIFNAGGNDFRLLTSITYSRGTIFIHDLLTHAEYTKDAWKRKL